MHLLFQRSAEEVVPPERAFRGIVGREPYPVGKKAEELLSRLKRGAQRLRSLFLLSKSRSELVATFLAVLELCKLHRIELEGEGADPGLRPVAAADAQTGNDSAD
jgi:segregation and condensation protein A